MHDGRIFGKRSPIRQTYLLPDYVGTSANTDEAKYGKVEFGPALNQQPDKPMRSDRLDRFIADFSPTASSRTQQKPNAASREEGEQLLELSHDRFQLHETLFNPGLIGLEQCSLSELVVEAIKGTDENIQPLFFANVILIGGMAALPGLRERL